jgi:hypothetical protein
LNRLSVIFSLDILGSLHKIARNAQVIYGKHTYALSKSTAISNPDAFPIYYKKLGSEEDNLCLWEEYAEEVNKRLMGLLGFYFTIRKSGIAHPEAGNGVFIQTNSVVLPGTLLGFVPGIIYDQGTTKIKLNGYNQERIELPVIMRYDGFCIGFDDPLYYPTYNLGYSVKEYLEPFKAAHGKPYEVDSHQVNPYGIGHLINHPPANRAPNVCFLELEIPKQFFSGYLLKYFPYMYYDETQKIRTYKGVGVFALESLENNDELFVNYGSERFSFEFAPEWLVKPPENQPIANFLNKKDALYEFSQLNKLLLKWDNISGTASESLERQQEQRKQERIQQALREPALFSKFYKEERK